MPIIRIKLAEPITLERFEKIQQEIYEWFGDIRKEDITLEGE